MATPDTVVTLILVSLFGFAATFVCIPLAKNIARTYNFLSYPGGHSHHDRPIPLLGGVCIYAPMALVCLGCIVLAALGKIPVPVARVGEMVSLFLGATWIMLLGLLDDKYVLSWKKKLSGELIGVLILIAGGHSIRAATIPFWGPVDFGWVGIPLFALTILTVTNAVNLIDGIDGLAGGICFFAALVSAVIGVSKGDLFSAALSATISGALLAFLRYNFPPASIFMGDAGSLMLGFFLGVLATSSTAISPGQRSGAMVMLLAPFLPFGIALLDVFLSLVRRWVTGRRLFLPDTDHLHHRLMERVGQPRLVNGILYAFSALLSVMTLSLVLGPVDSFMAGYIVFSGVLFLALAVLILRLYMKDGLPKIWENRPHFQYLAAYSTFMCKKMQRLDSLDDLLSLAKTGVSDLDFDSVEVLEQGKVARSWSRSSKIHPESGRVVSEKVFNGLNVSVRWIAPQHDSESYQKYLNLMWEQFLRELESRIRTLTS